MSVESKRRSKNSLNWASKYPKARKDNVVVDFYHDIKVNDPYRWLEDPHGIDTKNFVVRQNALATEYLEDFEQRDCIRQAAKNILSTPTRGIPVRSGGNYYQKRNNGHQNQDVLYVSDSLDKDGWVFLDPNVISSDGSTSLKLFSFSPALDHMAYGISISGSEWIMVKVRNTRTGEDLPETLYKIRNSPITWERNGKGFFYSGYLHEKDITYFGINTKPNRNQKVYYHILEEDQENDILVCGFDKPELMVSVDISNCGTYLIINGFKDCRGNSVHIGMLGQKTYSMLDLHVLVKNLDHQFTYVTNIKNKFLMLTDNGAHKFRLVSTKFNLNQGEENIFTDVIPEHKQHVLKWVRPINHNHLVACYTIDAEDHLSIYTSDGLKMMDLNIIPGTVTEISGEFFHEEMFVAATNFFIPNIIYRIDFTKISPEISVVYKTKLKFDVSELVDKEKLYCTSKDGIDIPIDIYKRKDASEEIPNPCLLCTHDEPCTPLTPMFNITHLLFVLNFNGVCAYAHIRGSTEFGRHWQNLGSQKYKPNAAYDLTNCAKHLIDRRLTTSNMLALLAATDGATIGAVSMNQNPMLFRTAILFSGVYDILRYNNFTCAHTWIAEYGKANNKDDFNRILRYSPLHNIDISQQIIKYPACLLVTADHDDLVVPSHSLKFIAALQCLIGQLPYQTRPLLLKMVNKCGHGNVKSANKKLDEIIDVLTFLAKTLRVKVCEQEYPNNV